MRLKIVFASSLFLTTSALANVIEPPMALIPGGEFLMGSDKGKPNEMPVHKVQLNTFYAGKYEVTVKEFRQFINATGFKRTEEGGDACWNWDSQEYIKPILGNWDDEFNAPSEFHPVMCITIDQAQAYVNWLAQQTGKPYRLLTESEWEYAARAGSTTPYFFGDSPEKLCEYGNVFDQSGKAALERDYELKGNFKVANCNDHAEYTSVVGMYKANPFGLYDTIGNVGELVQDCEHTSYENAPTNGQAWTENCSLFRDEHKMVITRGGSYGLTSSPMKLRSANREHFGVGNGSGSSTGEGFRIALDITNQAYSAPQTAIEFESELKTAQQAERTK